MEQREVTPSDRQHPNDSEELEMLLAELHWSHRGLSDVLGVRFESIVRWLDGRYTVPPTLLTWLRQLADFHRHHGLPEGWKGRPQARDRETRQ